MAIALGEFTSRYDDIKDKYITLYRYCSKNNLLTADRDKFEVSGPVAMFLLGQSQEFAALMRLEEADLVYNLTGRNSLIFTKILFSHFRRLERYFMFFAEGKVKESRDHAPAASAATGHLKRFPFLVCNIQFEIRILFRQRSLH